MKKISNSNINYKDKRKSSTNKSHVHDNVEVSGFGNTVNVKKHIPPIRLPGEEPGLDKVIRYFGRWLIGKKKSFVLSMILIPSVGSLYVIIDWKWLGFIEKLSDLKWWIRVPFLVWILVVIGLFIMLRRDTCPKCKRLLAIIPMSREQIAKTEYKGKEIYNIKENYKCDYCNYSFSKVIAEEE